MTPRSLVLRAGAVLLPLTAQPSGKAIPFERCFSSGRASARWEVPGLREASGLALTADGRLLVHGDESARVTAIDRQTGRVVGTFQLGSKPPRADFEGIAVVDSTGYLVTSHGSLYEFDIPDGVQRNAVLGYTVIRTPIGDGCEIEGLSYDAPNHVLLFACKHMKQRSPTAVFRWSTLERRMANPPRIDLDDSRLSRKLPSGELNPSSMEVDPASGDWVFVSSPNQLMAVATAAGQLKATAPIAKKHRQPEGLAISPDGKIYLSDEGGKGASSITVYACQ